VVGRVEAHGAHCGEDEGCVLNVVLATGLGGGHGPGTALYFAYKAVRRREVRREK
jgi:hypothetical protein